MAERPEAQIPTGEVAIPAEQLAAESNPTEPGMAQPGSARREATLPDHDQTAIPSLRTIEETGRSVAALVVVSGPEMGRQFQLRRHRAVIGRGEGADVVIHDKQVSRAHAAIAALPLGDEILFRLTDLGSTNHVYVNGARVEQHLLRDGDKIQLGEVLLKFELHDAIDAKFHAEIRNRILYDDLTGLLTYESFKTALSWELERGAKTTKGCAVVMMDLDDFKKLNDTFGHLAGSAVLREVGAVIRSRLRHFDVAARYGGEEFVAYLPDTSSVEGWTAAERLRILVAEHAFEHGGRRLPLTISMGVSHVPEDGRDLEALVARADERLYEAKRAGKNRVAGDRVAGDRVVGVG